MPSSNPLAFLRLLYDIAIWQFLKMLGASEENGGEHGRFTYKMHEVVAYFPCNLLQARAFSHIREQMNFPEAKSATENWSEGKPIKKMVEWCQDQ